MQFANSKKIKFYSCVICVISVMKKRYEYDAHDEYDDEIKHFIF
nr:MAG TPA: hypothetical protein [Caudoviricetes sp.]DAR13872.1 MAG TPA: hypothetical protein [Caudoviricetes sp.]